MISSYDRSTARIILHIIIVLHQRCLNCSEYFQRHLMFYTCNYNIRVTHRMVLLSIFFTRIRSTEGSSADCSLFILSLHALALHLAVKILLQSFCMKIWARWPCIHLSVVFPQNASRTALCYATNTIKWKHSLIFDINHQQNTRRSDQIETIKTIMQTTRPHVSHGRFYQWLRLPFLKEIFDQVRKDLDCMVFYSELKRHNVSHYITI